MKKNFDLLCHLWKHIGFRFPLRSGLFLGCCFITLADLIAIKAISYLVEDFRAVASFYFVTLAVSYILTFIVWLYKRRLPKAKNGRNLVVFALLRGEDGESDREIEKIVSTLKTGADFDSARKHIDFVALPANYRLSSEEESKLILRKTGAVVVVWGDVLRDKVNSRRAVALCPLKFTYITPNNQAAKNLNSGLKNSISHKQFVVRESEALIDRPFVTSNLVSVCQFVLGVATFSFGLFDKSALFFESIQDSRGDRQSFPGKEKEFHALVDLFVDRSYNFRILQLELGPKDAENSLKMAEAEILCQRMEVRGHNNALLKAMLLQIRGKVQQAIKVIHDAQQKYGSSFRADAQISLIYLYFWLGEYEKGYRILKKAKKHFSPFSRRDWIHVARWYEQALELDASRKQLLFPLGYLCMKALRDNARAQDKLRSFVESFTEVKDPCVVEMVSASNQLLSRME